MLARCRDKLMKTQCPNCRDNHPTRVLSLSSSGVRFQCTVCTTEFHLQKDSDTGGYERLNEKTCPKCGHTQLENASCNHCGVIFKKFKGIQVENSLILDPSIHSQSPAGTLKPLFRLGWASALLVISAVLVFTFLASPQKRAGGRRPH